jgi:HTH-type transcriptional repressor of NAD biosynthesis genes
VTRFRHGLIVGKFYPPHAGHHFLIDAAVTACERVTVVVAPSSGESIPLELRAAWLRETHPQITIAAVYDDVPVDYDDDAIWDAHCAIFRKAVREADAGAPPIDAVFSSEPYGDELAHRFDAKHVAVDPARSARPISGTAVRADPIAHWSSLSPPVRAWLTRRVIVVGAESTGTTTMARALAATYRDRGGVWAATRWVPEYGRELTERKLTALRAHQTDVTVFDVTWSRSDFVDVAHAQNAAEDAAARDGAPVLFGDTDAFATAVWEERYLGEASAAVVAAARRPDLYLLTDDAGVPFEDDGLRDGEHVRGWMSGRFRDLVAASGVPFVTLRGAHEQRLQAAITAVDGLIARGWTFATPLG